MENFNKEDLIKIVNFYKNKSSDLELDFLKLQITLQTEAKKNLEKNNEEWEKKLNNQLSELHTRILSLEKTLVNLQNKQNKESKNKKLTK